MALPSSAVQHLKRHQIRQKAERLKAEPGRKTGDLVFTKEIAPSLFAYGMYHCKRIAQAIGFPNVRFHDLRHTCATLSLKNGGDVKTLSNSRFQRLSPSPKKGSPGIRWYSRVLLFACL